MNSDLLGLKPVTDNSMPGASSGMAALVSQGLIFPSPTSNAVGVPSIPQSKPSSNSQQSHGGGGGHGHGHGHHDDATRKREVRLLKNRCEQTSMLL